MKRTLTFLSIMLVSMAIEAQTERPQGSPTSTMQGKEEVTRRREANDEKAKEAKKIEEEAIKKAKEKKKGAKAEDTKKERKGTSAARVYEGRKISDAEYAEMPSDQKKKVLKAEAEELSKRNTMLISRAEDSIVKDKARLEGLSPEDAEYNELMERIQRKSDAIQVVRNEQQALLDLLEKK